MTDLFDAKVAVLAAFASGPGVTLERAARDERMTDLVTFLELEFEGTKRPDEATVTPIRVKGNVESVGPVVDASRGKVNWTRIFADLRARPGSSVEVLYDKMRTAVVRASHIETHNDDMVAEAVHRGERAAVILAAVAPSR